MKTVQLLTLDPAINRAIADDPAYLDSMIESDWVRLAGLVHRHVGRTLSVVPLGVDTLAWDGYYAVDCDTREVVGSCAFKGAPSDEGVVEIAYLTYPDFVGRGYATAMAIKLIELATSDPAIKQVIAHTLPETSASTRVLEKAAMSFAGEVIDPDDGRVWRWQTPMEV